MRHRQVLQVIPFERLRPASGWGRHAMTAVVAGSLSLLMCHALATRLALPNSLVSLISVGAMAAAFYLGGGLRGRHPHSPHAPNPQRPDASSELRSWTCAGDVIELVFDSGAWLLVRGDVNDRQWRDVQRLLLWCKRVPARMAAQPRSLTSL